MDPSSQFIIQFTIFLYYVEIYSLPGTIGYYSIALGDYKFVRKLKQYRRIKPWLLKHANYIKYESCHNQFMLLFYFYDQHGHNTTTIKQVFNDIFLKSMLQEDNIKSLIYSGVVLCWFNKELIQVQAVCFTLFMKFVLLCNAMFIDTFT